MKKQFQSNKGFTLLEILLVIAMIGVLAAIVIVAINPNKQLAESRDAKRWSNVGTILNSVYQYAIDNSGNLPGDITITSTEICKTGVATSTCSTDGLVNLNNLVEDYLVALPEDPQGGSANGTGYEISKTSGNRITVDAVNAERGSISVTR